MTTDTSVSLENISTDVALSGEVRSLYQEKSGGITTKVLESVPVPAQQEVIFRPGKLVIALTELKQDLELGDTIDLVLDFKNRRENDHPYEGQRSIRLNQSRNLLPS